MTSEAVDVVRRGYAAYESDGIEGILQFLDPAVEWRNPPDSPIAGIFHGHEGVREWKRLTDEVFAELSFWPKEIIDAPYGRVLAIWRGRAGQMLNIGSHVNAARIARPDAPASAETPA